MNIAIFAGEVSGDLIGGALARELRRLCPDAQLWGMGGQAMREANVELLADSTEWGAISITAAIGKAPILLVTIVPVLKSALRSRRPDVVVLIDNGAFNIRAARFCKSVGLKVCYYFPPGSWRREGTKGAELARITDVLATPFTWATDRYNAMGANAVYVGHPIVERVRSYMTRAEFAGEFGMDANKPIIGMLPGSRRHEVMHLMPALLDAARLIYKQVPDAQFVVGVAPSISPDMMRGYLTGHADLRDRLSDVWHEFAQEAETRLLDPMSRTANRLTHQRVPMLVTDNGVLVPLESMRDETEARRQSQQIHARADKNLPPTVLAKGLTYEVMAHSDVLLTCSGTATLESAIFGTPMVIMYRGSKLMELEYNLRGIKKQFRFIGLPNILADRQIAPELIQNEASPEGIARHALALLNDPATRQAAKQGLAEVRASLGEPGASERAARLVLDLARPAA